MGKFISTQDVKSLTLKVKEKRLLCRIHYISQVSELCFQLCFQISCSIRTSSMN